MTAPETETAIAATRVAAYRRAAMEVARATAGDGGISTAVTIFYGIEAEVRVTNTPPDEVVCGDPAATEALAEIARNGLRTEVMRGWLHRNWAQSVRAG